MSTKPAVIAIVIALAMLAVPASGLAQEPLDPEGGVTEASDVERNAGVRARSRSGGRASASASGGGGEVRLGVQARIDAFNTLATTDTGQGALNLDEGGLLVPLVAPGVRFLDGRLFLGLGLGYQSISIDNGNVEESRGGWTFSPLATFDLLSDDVASLSLDGWLNLGSLGETEECDNNGCTTDNDNATTIGINLGAGVRGHLTPGLAIGGEFGWSFTSVSVDSGSDVSLHGLFGTILIEASVGL
ncbi:MAG: hypothetical protein PVI30_00830 [Myxococcales bacterium]|jgi:hypothetical protein